MIQCDSAVGNHTAAYWEGKNSDRLYSLNHGRSADGQYIAYHPGVLQDLDKSPFEEPERDVDWSIDGSVMPTAESLREHFKQVNQKEPHFPTADIFLNWYQLRTGQAF